MSNQSLAKRIAQSLMNSSAQSLMNSSARKRRAEDPRTTLENLSAWGSLWIANLMSFGGDGPQGDNSLDWASDPNFSGETQVLVRAQSMAEVERLVNSVLGPEYRVASGGPTADEDYFPEFSAILANNSPSEILLDVETRGLYEVG